MPLAAKPAADAPGLTQGNSYNILGYTGSTVLLLDDDKKLQHVAYAALEDTALWSLEDTYAKAPKGKAKAAAEAEE